MNKDDLQQWLDETLGDGKRYDELSRTLALSKDPTEWFKSNSQTLELYPGYNKFAKQMKPLDERFKSEVGDKDWSKASKAFRRDIAETLGVDESELDKTFEELRRKQGLTDEYQREQQLKYDRQKAVDDYKHSYLGMSEKNPLNVGLNAIADFVISRDTRKAIAEDPDNSGRIAGNATVDILGKTADALPGVGGIVAGPALRAGRDIAEDKDWEDVVANAGTDVVSNAVLAQGLKGVPGVKDIGFLHKIEEKFPMGQWSQAARAEVKEAPLVPTKFKDRNAIVDWIKQQPKEYQGAYNQALVNTQGKSMRTVNKALQKTEKDLQKKYYDEAYLTIADKAWTKNHPVKSALGLGYDDAVRMIERGSLGKGQEAINDKIEGKLENPAKIKGNYDKALDYIIRNTKKQWEEGFTPNKENGELMYEAWKKWKLEGEK